VVSEEGQGAHFIVEIPRQKAEIAAGDKAEKI
jgi:hypothetical protein